MKKTKVLTLIFVMGMILLMGCSKKETDQFSEPKKGETVAEIVIKDYGSIFVKFFDDAAPKAVENFVTHAKEGYYDGLTFHRIMDDFMIQGGDPGGTGQGGESIWGKNFEDEFSEDLQPYRGALCMANSGTDTNGSQFFIVQSKQTYQATRGDSTENVNFLDDISNYYGYTFNEKAQENYEKVGGTPWLYNKHTVFGQVYEGYEVLDAAASVEVDEDLKPLTDVIIEKINITDY